MTVADVRALHQVTLVVAPEGFGKSETVMRRLANTPDPVAHFYPREDQMSLFDLVHGLALALAGIAPGIATSFAGAAEYARQCSEPVDELALWIMRHLQSSNATVVLHDLDSVTEPSFFALVQRLIETSDMSLHWVCIARSEPPLPWETWRTYGLLGEALTTDDLRLNRDEALDIARKYGFEDAAALSLLDSTGGWPLGFRVGLRAPANGAAGTTYEHFALQIFSLLNPELQEFLIQSSVLSEFDPAFAAAAGHAKCWSEISLLADEGLLLVHKPAGLVRYRDAFRALLEQRLQERGQSAIDAARTIAASAYEGSGRHAVALRLYSTWGCTQDVLRVCESHGFDLIEHGHVAALSAALDTIQISELQSSAVALAVKAMEESRVGRHDIAEAWYSQSVASASDRGVQAAIAYRYALDLIRAGRTDGVASLESFADDRELMPDLRASIRATLATAYVMAGDFGRAREAIDQALAVADEFPNRGVTAKVLQHAAWVALFTGDVEKARTTAKRAVEAALECSLYDYAARAYSVLYNIAYDLEDEHTETEEILERILDCGVRAGSAPVRLFALLGMYDLATESGDVKTLRRLERSLLSYEVSYSDPMTSAALLSGQALILAGRGQFSEAYDLLVPTAERQITPDRCALRYSEIGLYAAAAHRETHSRDALAQVDERLKDLELDSRRTVRTVANVILARFLLGENDEANAMLGALLERAGSMSVRSRVFVEALSAIAARWAGTLNRATLAARFRSMQSRGLGGYTAVLSALPLSITHRPAEKIKLARPHKIAEALHAAREEIVESALNDGMATSENTLLCDLVASGVVERLSIWAKSGTDEDLVEWVAEMLEEQHGADRAAHLFSGTVLAAAKFLKRRGILDQASQSNLSRLQQTLDAHVSAAQVRRTLDRIEPVDAIDAKIDELLNRLLTRDTITFEHSQCVGAWCARLAKRMHLQRSDAQLVTRSGLIHDIGKVLTPRSILQAARALLPAEWEKMRRHTLDGVRLLEPVHELRALIPAVRWHHERYDGKGYPDAIPLQDIPFAARMVSVADAFNAMIARRPYREPLSPMVAIEELKRGSGSQFDPAIVDNMIDVVLHPDR